MIQLFKAKSLKSNTKQGTGVGAGVQGTDSKNARKQRGRSMVEMLGVLAIIGVLSIGGIQGYTMAMRRYRANEILDLVNKYALMVYTSCQKQMIDNPEDAKIYDTYHRCSDYENQTYADNEEGCYIGKWDCPNVPQFSDSGLGTLPAGVTINHNRYVYYDAGPGNIRIYSIKSGDIVFIPVFFENETSLCETLMSIVGISDNGYNNHCDIVSDGTQGTIYGLDIEILMSN